METATPVTKNPLDRCRKRPKRKNMDPVSLIKPHKDQHWSKQHSYDYLRNFHNARAEFEQLGKVCCTIDFDCTGQRKQQEEKKEVIEFEDPWKYIKNDKKYPRDINDGKFSYLNDLTWKGIPRTYHEWNTVPLMPATMNERYVHAPQGPYDWCDRRRAFPENPKSVPLDKIPCDHLVSLPDIAGGASSVITSKTWRRRAASRLHAPRDPLYHAPTALW